MLIYNIPFFFSIEQMFESEFLFEINLEDDDATCNKAAKQPNQTESSHSELLNKKLKLKTTKNAKKKRPKGGYKPILVSVESLKEESVKLRPLIQRLLERSRHCRLLFVDLFAFALF
jgi:hypothetical protein